MVRRSAAFVLATTLLIGPAAAETNWNLYKSFAHTRCEAPKTIADMTEAAKGLRFDNNVSVMSVTGSIKIVSATTLVATADTLSCKLHVQIQYDTNGSVNDFKGRYTIHIYPGNKWNTHFDPTY